MASFDLPQARVVKKGGQLMAPPPTPPEDPGPVATQLREALAVAIGLWPLTAVVVLMVGLLIMAGHWSAP